MKEQRPPKQTEFYPILAGPEAAGPVADFMRDNGSRVLTLMNGSVPEGNAIVAYQPMTLDSTAGDMSETHIIFADFKQNNLEEY